MAANDWPPEWAARIKKATRIKAAPTWVSTAYQEPALRTASLRPWSTSTSKSDVKAMSSHSTMKVATLPAAGTRSSVVTKSGNTHAAVRLSRPWRAYPMPCSVAGTATMATRSTKNAPNGLSTRSTPVSGSSSAECSTIGWPVASTWMAAAASSAQAPQMRTAATVTRDRLGKEAPAHGGPETEQGAGDDERRRRSSTGDRRAAPR